MDAALREVDSDIADAVERELGRERDTLELIASENFAPLAVLQAQGSVLTNKYAEGYPRPPLLRRLLLRRLRIRGRRGEPRHRASQTAVRCGARQRAAARRCPGERCTEEELFSSFWEKHGR
jgi:hypothetical protein